MFILELVMKIIPCSTTGLDSTWVASNVCDSSGIVLSDSMTPTTGDEDFSPIQAISTSLFSFTVKGWEPSSGTSIVSNTNLFYNFKKWALSVLVMKKGKL